MKQMERTVLSYFEVPGVYGVDILKIKTLIIDVSNKVTARGFSCHVEVLEYIQNIYAF